jgi:NAD(P)-dependent dehydrogenase (short-subunit alcohol dehydrogenase family)
VTPLDRRTSDGLLRVLAVNHLAPYLLLRTLAAALDRARFVVVAAGPVSTGRRPVDLDDLRFDHPERLGEPAELRPFLAYGRTKSMNATFTYTLARRMAGTPVTVNVCHPGVIGGTGLGSEVPGLGALIREAFRSGVFPPPGPQAGGFGPAPFLGGDGPGPDVGADTPVWLATSAVVEGVTGRFFVDRAPVETAPHHRLRPLRPSLERQCPPWLAFPYSSVSRRRLRTRRRPAALTSPLRWRISPSR